MLRWGLVPAWAKDPAIGSRMFNARAEGVADRPAFRAAFRRRRCLVPADGFYEWQPVAGDGSSPTSSGSPPARRSRSPGCGSNGAAPTATRSPPSPSSPRRRTSAARAPRPHAGARRARRPRRVAVLAQPVGAARAWAGEPFEIRSVSTRASTARATTRRTSSSAYNPPRHVRKEDQDRLRVRRDAHDPRAARSQARDRRRAEEGALALVGPQARLDRSRREQASRVAQKGYVYQTDD